jgi:uncharacterized phage protein gp47/JayE
MPIAYTKTKDQILNQMLQSLQKNSGITAVHPGAIARAFAEAIAVEVGDLYQALKFSVDQTSLSTAKGRALDLIGELYSVRRRNISAESEQDRSSYNIEFYISTPQAFDIVITKDTLVFNDVTSFSTNQYEYKLVEQVVIIAGTTRVFGRVIPNFESNDFTASVATLVKHNFSSPDGTLVFCSNPKDVYSMMNMESDDLFRLRISRSIKESSYGTNESLRLNALGIAGVRDVRVRESSYGLGSCDVIVVPESQRVDAALVQNVLQTLSVKKPVGIKLNIRMAERVAINVAVNIVVPSGVSQQVLTAVEAQASLFVKRYLNSMTIGSAMSFGDIESQIRSSSDFIKSVNILSVSANGQEVPKGVFRINSDKQYMIAGSVSVFSVIIS